LRVPMCALYRQPRHRSNSCIFHTKIGGCFRCTGCTHSSDILSRGCTPHTQTDGYSDVRIITAASTYYRQQTFFTPRFAVESHHTTSKRLLQQHTAGPNMKLVHVHFSPSDWSEKVGLVSMMCNEAHNEYSFEPQDDSRRDKAHDADVAALPTPHADGADRKSTHRTVLCPSVHRTQDWFECREIAEDIGT
jgi:hypothetical protein